ncbi:hypothetical protein C8J56DRAFT_885855 [Mycena floridula]|nr:hypothetical protein C8J56DRAFT_885855 [Mycena floridula]
MLFSALLPLFSAAVFTLLLTWNCHTGFMLHVCVLFDLPDYNEMFVAGWPIAFIHVNDTSRQGLMLWCMHPMVSPTTVRWWMHYKEALVPNQGPTNPIVNRGTISMSSYADKGLSNSMVLYAGWS